MKLFFKSLKISNKSNDPISSRRKFKKEYWNLSKYYDNNIAELQNNKYETLLVNSGIRLLEQKILEM